ncbi:MAG: ABC transporter permease [Actinomycetota bacterium]|nr:ABC transporter permease [Actinomycetota bacterium]
MSDDSSPASAAARIRKKRWRLIRSLAEDKVALAASIFIAVIVLAGVLAPWLAPHPPSEVSLSDRLVPPVWSGDGTGSFVLGADALGRDVLSRVIYGARVSLLVGFSVVIVAGVFGSAVGLVAGYRGGRVDTVLMRLADAQLAFPGLLLVILIISVIGSSIPVIIGVIAIYGWMIFARLVRGNVLQLREELFIRAAVMAGCGPLRLMRRHLLPNLMAPILTQAMLEFARVILVEASLSYLGLGIQSPNVSWGLMVAENQTYLREGWWTVFFPGLVLAVTVVALNLVASWLRVRSDPQQQQLLAARRRVRTEGVSA